MEKSLGVTLRKRANMGLKTYGRKRNVQTFKELLKNKKGIYHLDGIAWDSSRKKNKNFGQKKGGGGEKLNQRFLHPCRSPFRAVR